MEQSYLVDTNCIIDFAGGKLPDGVKVFLAKVLDGQPSISVINKIEILGFSNPGRAVLEMVDIVYVIGLTDDIVEKTIEIRHLHRIKLPDAIIAATAVCKNLALVTRNTSDFKMIDGLLIIDPWKKVIAKEK